jgi:predicted phosphodiesterase
MNKIDIQVRKDIIIEYLTKNPLIPTRTLATLLIKNHPNEFNNFDSVRSTIKRLRGEDSTKYNSKITMFKRTAEQKKEAMASKKIPESDYKEVMPFIMPKGNNRILVLTDIHIPYHDIDALQIALEYGKKLNPNAILLNGDTIDMYQASRFIKDRRLRDLAGELEMVRDFLNYLKDEFECPIYFKIGNHEARWENYLRVSAPELLGIADFELSSVLQFGALGIQEIKSTQIIKAGNLSILHGHEFGQSVFSPVNAARGLYMRAKSDSLVGHHHQTSEHSEKDLNGNVVTTWSVGCLAGLSPEYMPFNKWNHGFAYVEFTEDGNFIVNNHRIINGQVR